MTIFDLNKGERGSSILIFERIGYKVVGTELQLVRY